MHSVHLYQYQFFLSGIASHIAPNGIKEKYKNLLNSVNGVSEYFVGAL